jgi:hypothetical protein
VAAAGSLLARLWIAGSACANSRKTCGSSNDRYALVRQRYTSSQPAQQPVWILTYRDLVHALGMTVLRQLIMRRVAAAGSVAAAGMV